VYYSDGVKPECHLSVATAAKVTPFTDVPKSAPRVELRGFRTACSALCLANRASSIRV